MKKILLIFFVITISCSAKQEITNTEFNENKQSKLEVSIEYGETITFTIKNTAPESLYLYQPRKLHIEKFNKGTWDRLRILQCPCGAPCAKPPEKVQILNQEIYVRTWDKYEKWCGEKNKYGIPETLNAKALKGKYRLRVLYGIDSKQKETIYMEFELK
ncbi:MAG: hypothetical protein GQ564_04915 [Bacteroidales bacterium]|nr:hypothetical protein [Bacteroidales bacterium]